MQWFKRHIQFLLSEIESLSSCGDYKELYQKRDNFFVSHGEILVRYNGLHRHPILIFYPNSTPYTIPEIYPLSRHLEEEEINQISSSGISALKSNVIKQFYEYRHQNSSGLLCIIETDNLDTGSDFYSINTILGRVRDWFEAHLTNNFPPDNEEIELTAHFNNISNKLRFYYQDNFLNPEVLCGDFIGVTQVPISKKIDEIGRTYYGACLSGVTKNGIWKESNTPFNEFLQKDGFRTYYDFIEKADALKYLIKEGYYFKGYWFEINIEPKPFKEISDLVNLIGNGNRDSGITRIAKICLSEIKYLPNEIIFGIRYKNRRGVLEFQLFSASKKPENLPLLLDVGDEKQTECILNMYSDVKAIICEKINDESFFQRNGNLIDRSILRRKTINIIGSGAIGSEIADCISKAGIGEITIIDNQLLKIQNTVRHLAGLEYMGLPKAFAVKTILESHNPYLFAKFKIADIRGSETILNLPDESISISSIADDNVEGYLNEQAVLYNKTVYYVRALRGGKAARIFRVIPGRDSCFMCQQLHRIDGKHFINIPFDTDYPTLRNECNNPIRPASAADLKLISSIASRIILEQISKDSDINNWIWSTETIPNTTIDEAYKLYPHIIPMHNQCPYCSDNMPIKVCIDNEVLQAMKKEVLNKSGIETGGVLAGRIEKNVYHITNASIGGANAVEQPDKFEKDISFCQDFIDNLYMEHGIKAIYLGEWHSHPNQNNKPSITDLRSLDNIASQENYLISKPVMIIFSSEGIPSCTIHPAGSRFYYADLKVIDNG